MAKKLDYASLYTLRKDGRYMGYWHELDASGKPVGARHAIYDRDPETLYRKIQEKERPSALTFAAIAEAWKDYTWEHVARGTIACYDAPYKRAVALFGDRMADSITAIEISRHLEAMKRQGYGSKSVKTQRTVYKQIYIYAINDEVMGKKITYNPVLNVPLPKGLKVTKREAPEDEAVDIIRKSVHSARWGLFPFFLISTGCRRGEALGVKWEDVDFKAKTITIEDAVKYHGNPIVEAPKTSAGVRVVPLLPDLEAVLIKPDNAKPTDRIFRGEQSELMPESTYRRKWLNYCKDTGFVTDEPEERVSAQGKKYTVHHYKPTLTAHILRHGYATMLFEAEVDVYTAQRLLGHADVSTTLAIYTHLRQRKETASLEKLRSYVENNYNH